MTVRIDVVRSSPSTRFRVEADLIGQNIEGNYSIIRFYNQAYNGPSGSTGSVSYDAGYQQIHIDWVGFVDEHFGHPFLPSGYAQNALRWNDGPFDVHLAHNADGTHGGFTIRMRLNYANTGFADNDYTFTFGALPTIPRASTAVWAVPGNATAGVAKQLNTNRASTSFTHDITYTFGGASGTIGTGVTDSVNWTPPLSLLNQIPNSTTGTGTITTVTKSGATVIGTTYSSFTLEAAADIIPDFTTVTHAEATAGLAANVGAYVQGITTLSLFISGAAGVYGSTVASYKIEVAGQTINWHTGTSTPINASGTVNIVGTITDTRGRVRQRTIPITVMSYAPPSLTAISVQRALNTGVVDEDDGTYFRVNINAGVQSLVNSTQRNAINYRISTRVKGTSTWTVKANTAPGGITFNSFATVGTYALTTAYEALVEVYDDFTTSAIIINVPVAEIFMHWDSSLGVGIGKYRENGKLDIAGDIFHRTGAVVEPVGSVLAYVSSTPPAGWLICNGQEVSRTTYSDLFTLIGSTYGGGNGSTTFNVPNLSGRVVVGRNPGDGSFDAIGETGGAKTHVLTGAEMPAHDHFQRFASNAIAAGGGSSVGGMTSSGGVGLITAEQMTSGTGGGQAHNNLQPYMVLNYIIKT